MSTITTRAGKGSALTHNELDTNFKIAAQAKTTTYSVAESDNRDTIECSGTFTVTMPDVATVIAASDTGDFEVTLKNSGTGTVTVARATGTDTIDGSASNITIQQNEAVTLKTIQAGTGYNIISAKNPEFTKVYAFITSAATLAHNTVTTIPFDTEGWDTLGEFTTGTSSVFTAKKAGYYEVNAQLVLTGVSWTQGLTAEIRIIPTTVTNGQVFSQWVAPYTGSYQADVRANTTIYLTAGQTITIQAAQYSGTTANYGVSANGIYTRATINRVQ